MHKAELWAFVAYTSGKAEEESPSKKWLQGFEREKEHTQAEMPEGQLG